MAETVLTNLFYVLVVAVLVYHYLRGWKRREARAREAAERGQLHSEGPQAQHPQIDLALCIGCNACAAACPEGDVLAMLGGKAVIVNGHRCIGHGLCAEACPVGGITIVNAAPGMRADLPFLTAEYETSVPNLFLIGELGGLALIRNAVNQGRDCIDTITDRLARGAPTTSGVYDVVIAGAGPAGISASLRAIEKKLNYLTLERDEIGGTVARYPRQKLVMTSPVEFPMYGRFKKTELSKEDLLSFWNTVLRRADFKVRTGESVVDVKRGDDGYFTVFTGAGEYRAAAVALALGRAGTPRKLGVRGEELPKVMYRLIEADHYVNKRILVVGGGDSAIEAAMGLSRQAGNQVTLSYRKDSFSRIKERNAQRIGEYMRGGRLQVIFRSVVREFTPEAVVLEVDGEVREIANDFVWIFAGGVPPNDFLKKLGVAFGPHEMTAEAARQPKAALAG